MGRIKDYIAWHEQRYGEAPRDLSHAGDYSREHEARIASYGERERDYVAWHVAKYGAEPAGLEHAEEYAAERRSVIAMYAPAELVSAETVAQIRLYSPSVDLILRIQRGAVDLYDVSWRDFERILAELLAGDGWQVELRGGSKDGGVDVLAVKSGLACGDVLTVWQAKRLALGRRVELSTVRELADTRLQTGASKGVIVTSSFLTRGALERIQQDSYLLGKVDRDDLREWIRRYRS